MSVLEGSEFCYVEDIKGCVFVKKYKHSTQICLNGKGKRYYASRGLKNPKTVTCAFKDDKIFFIFNIDKEKDYVYAEFKTSHPFIANSAELADIIFKRFKDKFSERALYFKVEEIHEEKNGTIILECTKSNEHGNQ